MTTYHQITQLSISMHRLSKHGELTLLPVHSSVVQPLKICFQCPLCDHDTKDIFSPKSSSQKDWPADCSHISHIRITYVSLSPFIEECTTDMGFGIEKKKTRRKESSFSIDLVSMTLRIHREFLGEVAVFFLFRRCRGSVVTGRTGADSQGLRVLIQGWAAQAELSTFTFSACSQQDPSSSIIPHAASCFLVPWNPPRSFYQTLLSIFRAEI